MKKALAISFSEKLIDKLIHGLFLSWVVLGGIWMLQNWTSSTAYNWFALFLVLPFLGLSKETENSPIESKIEGQGTASQDIGLEHQELERAIERSAQELGFFLVSSTSEQVRRLFQFTNTPHVNSKQYMAVLIEMAIYCTMQAKIKLTANMPQEFRTRFQERLVPVVYERLSKGFTKRSSEDEQKFITLSTFRLNQYEKAFFARDDHTLSNLFTEHISCHFPNVPKTRLGPLVLSAVFGIIKDLEKHWRL